MRADVKISIPSQIHYMIMITIIIIHACLDHIMRYFIRLNIDTPLRKNTQRELRASQDLKKNQIMVNTRYMASSQGGLW